MLEADHKTMFCLGGEASIVNLELKCRVHNHYFVKEADGSRAIHRPVIAWSERTLGRRLSVGSVPLSLVPALNDQRSR